MQALTVVSALAVPLQSKSNIVQSRAAMCLASFCYDAQSRRELRESGAITHLVNLLGRKIEDELKMWLYVVHLMSIRQLLFRV